MKTILIASFISLTVTVGGYIAVVKMGAGRKARTEEALPLTKEEIAAAELQLKGADQQVAMAAQMSEAVFQFEGNVGIARKILVEEQQKIEKLHRDLLGDKKAIEEHSEENLGKLAKLYESMKAPDAAKIISQLNNDLIIQIVSRMKDKSAAKLLAALDSQRAAELTRRMSLIKNPKAKK